jgi:hypothetical protein
MNIERQAAPHDFKAHLPGNRSMNKVELVNLAG